MRERGSQAISLIRANSCKVLTTIPRHTTSSTSRILGYDVPLLSASFPVSSRLLLSLKKLCCCGDREESFVNEIEARQRQIGAGLGEQEFKDYLAGRIPEIKVLATSRLELDPNIGHPFVRIHAVNMRNGVYRSKKVESHTSYRWQNIVQYNKDLGMMKGYETDIVLPLSTNNCDFRLEGSSCCQWEDIFKLNIPAVDFFDPDLLLLFQLLDFNHQLLVSRKHSNLRRDLTYPIAWAYLRPVGLAKRHIGVCKLQLYRYQCQAESLPSDFPECGTPDVYFDFIWPRKQKYPGFLSVVVQGVAPPQTKQKYVDPPLNIFEIEVGNKKYFDSLMRFKEEAPKEKMKVNKELIKIMRLQAEPCYLPDEIHAKLPTAVLGCYRLAFSQGGNLLVCACSSLSGVTSLRFFETLKFKLIYQFSGHSSWIHSIEWSLDDKYLLSASSDRTARLWEVPEFTQEFIDQLQSQSLLLATTVHAAFVYAATIVSRASGRIYFATSTSNGQVMLWECQTSRRQVILKNPLSVYNLEDNLQESVFANCLTFQSEFLYAGDNIGRIHALDIQRDTLQRVSLLANEEMEGVGISSIKFMRNGAMLVASKNNVIRMIEFTTTLEIKRRFFGSTMQKQNIGSAISPDSRLMIAGSQDGKPICWELESGMKADQHLDLEVRGTISDCSWNNKLHMVAIGAFGDEFPAYIFIHRKTQQEEEEAIARLRAGSGQQAHVQK